MYPMTLSFPDYIECQPLRMLLQQKKTVILSLKHKPHGKLHVTKKFRPPKQMVNKWFFQDMFSDKPLILMKAAVCDLLQPDLGPSGGNRLVTLKCINIHNLYINGSWGINTDGHKYSPVSTWSLPKTVKVFPQNNPTVGTDITIDNASNLTIDKGWFQTKILNAYKLQIDGKGYAPIYEARYNPANDTGKDNLVYLCSVTTSDYRPPQTDKILYASNQPLWMLLFGFMDYIIYLKTSEVKTIYYLIISSPYIEPHTGEHYQKTHLVVDDSFIKGLGPFNIKAPIRFNDRWYPTLEHQQDSMANIVKAGPFVPKPDPKYQNWELHYKSTFYFKWGGSIHQDTQILNPKEKSDYIVPDNLQSAVQITDPKKQIPETMLHSWDFRRDFITKTAFKRMSEHLETESILSTDTESQPPAKICRLSACTPHLQEEETQTKSCLLSLFEENTCQEQEEKETSLRDLIKQQQQQQQQIKFKLLQLLTHMKRQQHQLQLNTGLLE